MHLKIDRYVRTHKDACTNALTDRQTQIHTQTPTNTQADRHTQFKYSKLTPTINSYNSEYIRA